MADGDQVLAAQDVLMPFAYVIPQWHKDAAVQTIKEYLLQHEIYTVGRFGEWALLQHRPRHPLRQARSGRDQGEEVEAPVGERANGPDVTGLKRRRAFLGCIGFRSLRQCREAAGVGTTRIIGNGGSGEGMRLPPFVLERIPSSDRVKIGLKEERETESGLIGAADAKCNWHWFGLQF